MRVIDLPESFGSALALHAASHRLASAGDDGVRICDTRTGETTLVLSEHESDAVEAAFSPEGSAVAGLGEGAASSCGSRVDYRIVPVMR